MNNKHPTKEAALAACWEQIKAGGCDRQARMDASIDHRLEQHFKMLANLKGHTGKRTEIDEEKARESMGYGTGRLQGD